MDDYVQTQQEMKSTMEEVVNSQVKQLKSLLNSLSKRKEAFEENQEEDVMSLSSTSDSLQPCSRARVKSEPWGQREAANIQYDNLLLEEEECDSEESFKTASDE